MLALFPRCRSDSQKKRGGVFPHCLTPPLLVLTAFYLPFPSPILNPQGHNRCQTSENRKESKKIKSKTHITGSPPKRTRCSASLEEAPTPLPSHPTLSRLLPLCRRLRRLLLSPDQLGRSDLFTAMRKGSFGWIQKQWLLSSLLRNQSVSFQSVVALDREKALF